MVQLRLIVVGTGVRLIACDENGRRLHNGNLLEIRDDGRIERYAGVNSNFGFVLDSNDRIAIAGLE